MKFNYKKLGELIELSEEKNKDLTVTNLIGMNINKEFMPSVANTVGTNLSRYKIIKKNQFAYNNMQVGRDRTIRVARYDEQTPSIISPAYKIFQVIDENIMNPEFLMLYFLRPEFDRLCWFYTDSSVRGSLDWSTFCNIEVPVPNIKIQQKIVKIYNFFNKRIELKNQINKTLEKILHVSFEKNFIEIDDQNIEFKESDLGEIPKEWNVIKLGDLIEIIDNRGRTPPLIENNYEYPIIEIKSMSNDGRIVDFSKCSKFVNEHTYNTWFRSGHPQNLDILISTVGTIAELKLFLGSTGCIAQNIVALRTEKKYALYLYQYLTYIQKDLMKYDIGAVQPSIKVTHIIKHPILIPTDSLLNSFNDISNNFTNKIYNNTLEIEKLIKLRDNLNNKLMSGEIDVSNMICDF